MKSVFSFCFLMIFALIVQAQSEIVVGVQTNVNKFQCTIKSSDLLFQKNKFGTQIQIPVKAFKCPQKMMDKELQELFAANKYPFIVLDLENSIVQNQVGLNLRIKSKVNRYKFKVQLAQNYLTGTNQIKLTEFGLVPPTKMLGTVKVKDEVNIQIKLDKNLININ